MAQWCSSWCVHVGGGSSEGLLTQFTEPSLGDRYHRITSVAYSHDSTEVLVSYSSEYIYLFGLKVATFLFCPSLLYCSYFWHLYTWLWSDCTVWVKKSSPLKLFAVFSFLVNLCNWKLPWLSPKHIPMSTQILVHLSGYLCEMYYYYRWDPSNFKKSIEFVTKFMIFFVKTHRVVNNTL